ncbi:MAG TPA: ATP-binding protein [Candidatus Eisenbacteria bacterium]|nr:ATP-binding protein [Candidatus Eisenbacteria bacterium]
MDAGRHRHSAPHLTLIRSHAAPARDDGAWEDSLARESDAGNRVPSSFGSDTTSGRHTMHVVFALLVTAVFAVFQLATWPLLEASPFLLFCAGAVIAASVAGFEGGVITTLSSALVAQFFFITPHRLVPNDPKEALGLAGFLATGFLISLLVARLDRDRARLARVLDSVSDGFVSVDRDGRCRYANEAAAALEGRSREELVGEPFDLVPGVPLDRTGLRDHEPARVEGYVANLERWIEVTSYPAEDGTTLLYRDVTARHEFDEAIQRAHDREREARTIAESASRAKDEFLAMISHELRAPLTSILGWLRLLQEGSMDEKETPRALDTIERNATALSHLVGDVLDVSRLVSGKLELDRRLLDPEPALRTAADAVRPLAQRKQIEIVVETYGARPVFADAARLHQILWNLLANAVKFTPQGGRVHAALRTDVSDVVFTISDNGIGIRPEFLPHVFDRFSQHDSSYSRRFTGLGLGLAIARNLAEMHGGSVEAKSAGEGQGATFVVRIPRALREESFPRMEPVPPRNGLEPSPFESGPGPDRDPESTPERLDRLPSLQGLRVLVVDDEPDARALVVEILTRRGANVRACPSAVEGRALFAQWRPDVLVSDIGLPEESGYSLIRSIRALGKEQGGDVPAIALTGYARLTNRLEALSAGYDLHIPKPVEPSELVLMVASVAGRLTEGPLGHPRPYRT